jgi:hypothetical protein
MSLDELSKLLMENHSLALLSSHPGNITKMCEFVELWCELPAIVVKDVALGMFEVLQIIAIRAKDVASPLVAGFQIAFFLIAISGGPQRPKMNLATRLSEVLLVEERNEYQRVGAKSCRQNDRLACFACAPESDVPLRYPTQVGSQARACKAIRRFPSIR